MPPPASVPAPPLPSPAPAAATQPAVPAQAADEALLFEAFCAGARLSPSAFAGEDRVAVMQRLGEVYRHMVLGLADLMGERTALKNEYRMTRTMVRPEGNNPFKWAPPRRLAIEVLKGGDAGFADGGEAVAESFREVRAHLLCMLAGMRAAVGTTIDALSPQAVERAAEGRFLLKAQRDARLWEAFVEHHARFRAQADDDADGPINRAFRQAYERQDAELDGRQAGYGGPGGNRS